MRLTQQLKENFGSNQPKAKATDIFGNTRFLRGQALDCKFPNEIEYFLFYL